MELKLIEFHEDTNTCELEVDDEAKQMLMALGFNELLRKALEVYENEPEKK